MTIQQALKIARARYWTSLLGLAIGMVGGLVAVLLTEPIFSSSLQMYVAVQADPGNVEATYQGSLLSEQRVRSYVELASSDRVAGDVKRALNLPRSTSEIARSISAEAPAESVVLTITAESNTREGAAQIADGVGVALPELVSEIERPASGAPAQSPVILRVIAPADIPETPIVPNRLLYIAFGGVLGVIAGLGLIFARATTDNRLSEREQLESWLETPFLGRVDLSKGLDTDRRGAVQGKSIDFEPEQFRRIRTNLEFLDVDNPRKVLLVASALPGEGKTTLVCNLARALSAAGKSVVVVDADLRNPSVARYLKIDGDVGITTVLSRSIGLDSAVRQLRQDRFSVLPSGRRPANPNELLSSMYMKDLIDTLRSRFQYVLLDSAPMLVVSDSVGLATRCDGVVLTAKYRAVHKKELFEVKELLDSLSVPILGSILSMAPPEVGMKHSRYAMYADPGEDSSGLEYVNVDQPGGRSREGSVSRTGKRPPSPTPRG